MKLFKLALTVVLLSCLCTLADMTVVSVNTNSAVNVDKIAVENIAADNASIGTVSLSGTLSADSSGVIYVTSDSRTISMSWPTNYVYAYTNYPGRFDNYRDPLVTEWFLRKSVDGLKADLSVFGDKHFFERYTNSPPTNIYSLLGYVSNCVYLLSNVQVQQSYNDVSNELEQIKTRLERTERTADRFGYGVNDLDYIIDSNIEDMDAENMLNMIKVLATYIKYGVTNEVANTRNSEEAAEP